MGVKDWNSWFRYCSITLDWRNWDENLKTTLKLIWSFLPKKKKNLKLKFIALDGEFDGVFCVVELLDLLNTTPRRCLKSPMVALPSNSNLRHCVWNQLLLLVQMSFSLPSAHFGIEFDWRKLLELWCRHFNFFKKKTQNSLFENCYSHEWQMLSFNLILCTSFSECNVFHQIK